MKNNRKIAYERERLARLARDYWGIAETSTGLLDIVSLDDIRKISGYKLSSLYVFSTRKDFPAPVARKRQQLFWRRADIDTWLRTKRLPGSSPGKVGA